MTDQGLLEELKKITEEEKRILNGGGQIEPDIYMQDDPRNGQENVIDAGKLLDSGKLIRVRPHTRFVHFPKHTHNYIEVIYMCAGHTHHVIDGEDVILEEGDLLFLNQRATQEIYPASEEDIAVNFIILPEFFDYGLHMMGEERNLLRDFVVDCLKGENQISGYLLFKAADVLPIQNLIENLIWTIWNKQPNKRSILQATMGLLFLQLLNHMERMETTVSDSGQKLMFEVLGYIEEHYRDGSLQQLAETLNYDVYFLSKEIKRLSGHNYIELIQEKRLNQATYLLEHTAMSVLDVGQAAGYENQSYFHRIFKERFHMSPKKYRTEKTRVQEF